MTHCRRFCNRSAVPLTLLLLGASLPASAELIFEYRFEGGPAGGAATTISDSSGNGLAGTGVGVSYSSAVAGPGAGSFSLDASGDYNYVEIASNPVMFLQEFRLSLLAFPNAPYGTGGVQPHVLIAKKTAEAGTVITSWAISYSAENGRFLAAVDLALGTDLQLASASSYAPGQWYEVALALDRDIDGDTDFLGLYVDDDLVASTLGVFGDVNYNGEELVIGAANFMNSPGGTYRRNFNGLIDEVRLSSDPEPVAAPAPLALLALGGLPLSLRRRLRARRG